MSASIELKIQKLSQSSKSIQAVADSLVEESVLADLKPSEVEALGNFCYRCGNPQALIRLCIHSLENNRSLPWESLVRSLHHSGALYDPKLIEAVYAGALQCNALEALADSRLLDSEYPHLKRLRLQRTQRVHSEHQLKREHLIDQIDIARTQQLLDEEKRLIDRLSRLFPGESLGSNQRQLFKERWARNLLSNRNPESSKSWAREETGLSPEQLGLSHLLKEQAIKIQQETPAMGSDLCSIFLMIEDYKSALELLKAQPSSFGKDWLEVEVLLWMRHFVEAMTQVQVLESRHAKNPETSFAAAYLKAQALWGLQKRESALEIMESVVSARPSYRSAHSYLNLWRAAER